MGKNRRLNTKLAINLREQRFAKDIREMRLKHLENEKHQAMTAMQILTDEIAELHRDAVHREYWGEVPVTADPSYDVKLTQRQHQLKTYMSFQKSKKRASISETNV